MGNKDSQIGVHLRMTTLTLRDFKKEENMMTIETARGIAARIWGDPEYSHVTMNVEIAEKIARMLLLIAKADELSKAEEILCFGQIY